MLTFALDVCQRDFPFLYEHFDKNGADVTK